MRRSMLRGILALVVFGLGLSEWTSEVRGQAETAVGLSVEAQPVPHLLWSTPFVLLLLAIALLPLVPVAHHWWERNGFKLLVGLSLSAVVLCYYGLRGYGAHGHEQGMPTVLAVMEHAVLRDYLPFLILLYSSTV